MKSSLTGKILLCPQCGESFPKTINICPKDGTILIPPPPENDPFVGKLIDQKYKILERLGGGGMGVVYKAEHVLMGRVVVLKVLHRHLAEMGNEGEFLKRFQREARTASQIEHPNAVTLYDFGIFENQPYIVMQFIRGETLKALLAREGRLSPERAVRVIRQVGEAISEAHRLQIIHRDLKPENIMITRTESGVERAQVLDFGLAKVMSEMESADHSMTKTGVVLGTPYYMAPEQAIASTLDARTEVYSLGVILYEMLAGRVPFKADTAMEIMLKHIKEKPAPFSSDASLKVSAALEGAVMTAIKKEPKNRFESVAAFTAALDEALQPAKLASSIVVSTAPTPTLDTDVDEQKSAAPSQSLESARRVRRWSIAAVCSMLFLGTSMGFALNPVVTYFSPEETARRVEGLKRKKEVQDILKTAKQFAKEGNLKAAFYEYNRAIERNPNDVEVYVELGRNYYDALRYDQAVIVLEKAVKLDPDSEESHFILANTLFKQGSFAEAAKHYKKTLDLNPKNKAAKKNLQIAIGQSG